MSEFEILGKYDVKEPQLFKMTVRQNVNDMYKRLCLFRDTLQEHLDFEELFNTYFEQFCDEYTKFLCVIEFMHEVGMLSDVIYGAVLMQVETIESEIVEFYKIVNVLNEENLKEEKESAEVCI